MLGSLVEAFDSKIIDLLALFGRDTTPTRPGEAPLRSGDYGDTLLDRMGGSGKIGGLYPTMSRTELVKLFRDMDTTGLASSIIDMQAEDTLAPDTDTGMTLTLEGPAHIRHECEAMFNETDLEHQLPYFVRNSLLYGSEFARLVYSSENGVTHLVRTKVDDVSIETDPKTDEIRGYKHTGIGFRGTKNPVSWPFDFLHFKVFGKGNTEPYGTSILEPAIRAWTQMVMAEDMALMYRIKRLPDRLLFEIDVGNAPEAEAWRQVQEFKKKWRRNYVIDPSLQLLKKEYNPVTAIEDIFLAKRPNSTTRVGPLTGAGNVNDMTDVSYYAKQFIINTKMPPGAFGFDDPAGAASPHVRTKRLTNQDIRYARHVKNLQRDMCRAIFRLCEIHLHLKAKSSIDPLLAYFGDHRGKNRLIVKMQPPSFLAELERLEVMQLRVQIAETMLQFGMNSGVTKSYEWTMWLMKHVLQMPDRVINSILQAPKPQEPEVGYGPVSKDTGGQGDGGQGNLPKPKSRPRLKAKSGSKPSQNGTQQSQQPQMQQIASDILSLGWGSDKLTDSDKDAVITLVESSPELQNRLHRLRMLIEDGDDDE